MASQSVEFIYYFGTYRDLLPDQTATLEGSWNAQGFYSDSWTSVAMEKFHSPSDGIGFRALVSINQSQTGVEFKWGVRLTDPATDDSVWAIATENNEGPSRARFRWFRFQGEPQTEIYYLTQGRRLGAAKVTLADASEGRRFRVWAPNALNAELVFGHVWHQDDQQKRPGGGDNPLPTDKLAGGYIFDNGEGLHPAPEYAPVAMQRMEEGLWEVPAEHPALARMSLHQQLYLHQQPYMFRITRDDHSVVYRTDIYARRQAGQGTKDPSMLAGDLNHAWSGRLSDLAGRVSCSVVGDPERVIKDTGHPVWPAPLEEFLSHDDFWADEFNGQSLPARVEDLIIYELHIGALGFGKEQPGDIGDALALLDHISGLNVNAIELLPLSEFAGDASHWGYATSHYFAIEHLGGNCDELKHFVKACHQRGIAVIMDVVYNHYDHHAERAQRYYDSPLPEHDIYYWYQGKAEDYAYLQETWGEHAKRGGYLENLSTGDAPAYKEPMVRNMLISSAVALLEIYHIDGFRVDQTTSIHQYNRLRATGEPLPEANIFGAKFLRELGNTLRLLKPDVLMIAEDHSEWGEVVKPVAEGGMGFDARWYSDFYHHLLGDTNSGDKAKLLKAAADDLADAALPMDVFASALWETQFDKVVYSESHDEAGNSTGPFLDDQWNPANEGSKRYTSERTINVAVNSAPLVGTTRKYAEARCRFAWGMTVLSAGTPMFLFGDEVGAEKRFKYNTVLENKEDLNELRMTTGHGLYRFYSEINQLRLNHTALRSKNIDIVHVNNASRVIVFRRWDRNESFLIVASLANQPYSDGYVIYSIRIPSGGWQEVFNSDAVIYGGDNKGNGGQTVTCHGGRIQVVIPFAGFAVFKKVD